MWKVKETECLQRGIKLQQKYCDRLQIIIAYNV